MLGFAPHRILFRGLKAYYDTSTVKDFKHYYLNQHYPINPEEQKVNFCELLNYGIEHLDAGRNLGLHEGFNFVINHINPNPEDIIIAYDPDCMPLVSGWDQAMVDVLNSSDNQDNIGWVTLMNPQSKREMEERGYRHRNVSGHIVWLTDFPVTNNTCAWRADFILKAGGITENRPWYGHLETPMFYKMKALGFNWGFVEGFPESWELREMADLAYQKYKVAHAHTERWDGDFESWINAGMPE